MLDPGALLLAALSAAAFLLSYRVCREFSNRDPLSTAWRLICAAAAVDLCGEIFFQWLGPEGILNPPPASPWPLLITYVARDASLFFSGPLRFGLMAAGCLHALKVYRRSGFLGKLR